VLQGILTLQNKIAGQKLADRYQPSPQALTRGLVPPPAAGAGS
jgi:NADH-quinone oxidoreductase subunit B